MTKNGYKKIEKRPKFGCIWLNVHENARFCDIWGVPKKMTKIGKNRIHKKHDAGDFCKKRHKKDDQKIKKKGKNDEICITYGFT